MLEQCKYQILFCGKKKRLVIIIHLQLAGRAYRFIAEVPPCSCCAQKPLKANFEISFAAQKKCVAYYNNDLLCDRLLLHMHMCYGQLLENII